MLEKLEEFSRQLEGIDARLADGETMKDMKTYTALMQERSRIAPIVESLERLSSIHVQIDETKEMIRLEEDAELQEMARQELADLESQAEAEERKAKMLLIPPDPLEGKNIIMEIRAGTGGDEASLFAADLFRMYSHYAESKRWKLEVMNSSESGVGGYKEIVCSISGKDVYGFLRFESGVHRVQRVPETESSGRIHTSAVTVAVLPEAEETDIEIRQEDLKIDVMRAGGPGGQCVMEESRKRAERAAERKSQVGSGDRSERIRTYNFPQNRVTDHRINLTLYHLDQVINGDLDEIVEPLRIAAGEEALKNS